MSEAPTIADLFAKDPLNLTTPNIEEIILYYRDNRVKFVAGMKTSKEDRPKTPKVKGPVPDINLDDLEL